MTSLHKILSLMVIIFIVLLNSCSFKKLAVNMIADTLSSGAGTAFTGDDDPELIRDALPFALKMYESLLEQAPENRELLLTTGSGFVMYANAFVHTPADMLPDMEFELQEEMLMRARRLYLRGRDYVLRSLDLKYPGFSESVQNDRMDQALEPTTIEDVPNLFWAGAGWMGAISASRFDIALMLDVPKAISLMDRALELDESWGDGSIHEFFLSYYGSMPASMGGSEEKARYHFRKTLEFSQGMKASPYVALASSVCVNNQDASEYRQLLDAALAIDPDSSIENRLSNILSQRKARWLLDHIEDYFLLESEEGDT